ncbi:MAG: hypothetical protein Q7R86_02390, partial [bacterium]|nr:hypothetical protein [bacterium]
CDDVGPINETGLDPLEPGEEIIGELTDKRVKAFQSLIRELESGFRSKIQNITKATIGEIGEMSLDKILEISSQVDHLEKLVQLASDLLWRGVLDTIPAAAEPSRIAIRKDWQVVKCPSKEEGEDVKTVMTPFGPAIAIGMLMGRKS